MRVFLALDVSDEVRARVVEAVNRERTTVDAKWVTAESLHLTLVFFGDLTADRLPALLTTATEVATPHAPLDLEIAGAGTFDARVLWLGVRGALQPLEALALQLSAALGVKADHATYTPHLTLARSIARKGDRLLDEAAARLNPRSYGRWVADHLTVYESRGGRYLPLARIPFTRR